MLPPNITFGQLVGELETVTDPSAVDEILDQFVAKLQRKKRHLSDDSQEMLESVTGMPIDEVAAHLKQSPPAAAAQWLTERKQIAQMLDRRDGGRKPVLVSYHADKLLRVEQGYGVAEDGAESGKPEDYLDSFQTFITENQNTIPALMVVMQRPRDLTRQDLKDLRMELSKAGYSETQLKAAWRDKTNEEIAASIIGYIRQAALGDALMPYGERVQKAMKTILASQPWTPPQRRWLERIGKQLEKEYVVDRAALDQGAFKREGGFNRLNKIFKGKLEEVLTNINQALWEESS